MKTINKFKIDDNWGTTIIVYPTIACLIGGVSMFIIGSLGAINKVALEVLNFIGVDALPFDSILSLLK